MQKDFQPRGYSSSGFVALINGQKMEFATSAEYREYITDEDRREEDAA